MVNTRNLPLRRSNALIVWCFGGRIHDMEEGLLPYTWPKTKIPHFLLYFWKIRIYKVPDMAEYCKAIYMGPYGPGIPIILEYLIILV
jgi:hypothetical protein